MGVCVCESLTSHGWVGCSNSPGPQKGTRGVCPEPTPAGWSARCRVPCSEPHSQRKDGKRCWEDVICTAKAVEGTLTVPRHRLRCLSFNPRSIVESVSDVPGSHRVFGLSLKSSRVLACSLIQVPRSPQFWELFSKTRIRPEYGETILSWSRRGYSELAGAGTALFSRTF